MDSKTARMSVNPRGFPMYPSEIIFVSKINENNTI